MKKLLLLCIIVLLLSNCTSLRKQAGYPKGTPMNTDWKIRKL